MLQIKKETETLLAFSSPIAEGGYCLVNVKRVVTCYIYHRFTSKGTFVEQR